MPAEQIPACNANYKLPDESRLDTQDMHYSAEADALTLRHDRKSYRDRKNVLSGPTVVGHFAFINIRN